MDRRPVVTGLKIPAEQFRGPRRRHRKRPSTACARFATEGCVSGTDSRPVGRDGERRRGDRWRQQSARPGGGQHRSVGRRPARRAGEYRVGGHRRWLHHGVNRHHHRHRHRRAERRGDQRQHHASPWCAAPRRPAATATDAVRPDRPARHGQPLRYSATTTTPRSTRCRPRTSATRAGPSARTTGCRTRSTCCSRWLRCRTRHRLPTATSGASLRVDASWATGSVPGGAPAIDRSRLRWRQEGRRVEPRAYGHIHVGRHGPHVHRAERRQRRGDPGGLRKRQRLRAVVGHRHHRWLPTSCPARRCMTHSFTTSGSHTFTWPYPQATGRARVTLRGAAGGDGGGGAAWGRW